MRNNDTTYVTTYVGDLMGRGDLADLYRRLLVGEGEYANLPPTLFKELRQNLEIRAGAYYNVERGYATGSWRLLYVKKSVPDIFVHEGRHILTEPVREANVPQDLREEVAQALRLEGFYADDCW